MRKTIYLHDELAAQVEEYLKVHQDETFSSLVQRALKREVAPKRSGRLAEAHRPSAEGDTA